MNPSRTFVAALLVFASASITRPAAAQDAPDAAPAPPSPPSPPTPPILERRVEATYPPAAQAEKLEAQVGLELVVDETGHVTDVKVVAPAGHGFDEAAADAARQFVFAPAQKDGKPIKSVVAFTYEFHLPEPAVVAPSPPPPPPPRPEPPPATTEEVQQPGESEVVLAQRPLSAASSFSVRDRDFQLRPIGSVQDILRVTPGLVVVQHSGGGKANQYFLRGFDVDHGTDLALSIDGVPINMVSHAHGQGFADTNFIIPEVVERVEITKGPYFASQGDFATAGAVNMVSRDGFEHSSIGLGGGGSPGHGAPSTRGLLIASPRFGETTKATFAAEVGRQNGPFENPEGFDRYKLFNKVSFEIGSNASLTLGEMSYGGAWHGSGQIPSRAVEQGLLSRFGSIDPDEGGYSTRHQLSLQYRMHPTDRSQLTALAYVGRYTFDLFSNFTLYARDPENGDEIEQVDRRTFYGGKVSYRVVEDVGPLRFDTTIGGDARSDDIRGELWDTLHRRQLKGVRQDDVHESTTGLFVNEELAPIKWLRADVGGRADGIFYAVDDRLPSADAAAPKSGAGSATQLSPKASVVVSPLDQDPARLDVYLNYGQGFHSNDVRGAFATPAVTPLTRAIGEEVGARGRFFDRWDLAAALWELDLDNETVWSGDEGTTEVSGATKRHGAELETRFEFTKWLAADLDVTFTRSAFRENAGNGNGLALAPKQTWAGGLSARHVAGPGVARGGLRFYGIGDRPATDDGQLTAPGFTLCDLHLGYRLRRFDLAFDVENLFNANARSAQFATTGRLRTEPAIGAPIPAGFSCGSNGRLASDASVPAGRFAGCEDVHFTPQYPTTLRVLATVYLD